jgi:MFS superfamily sulfate permease-like transporter
MKRNLLEIPKSFKKGEPINAILTIDDELSFINALGIATEIQKHIKEFDQLNINANIAHIDLTGIQLLYSIKKSCENNQKKVNFNIKIGQEQKDLIVKAGFNELFIS